MARTTKEKHAAAPAGRQPAVASEILRLMRAVEHGLQSASKMMAKDGGVTGPQRSVLRAIAKQPGGSASDVAGAVHLHASTVTGILQRLLERGLVTREKSQADARKAALQLTELGKRASEVKAGVPESAVKRVCTRFSPDELECALRVLGALADELQ